jgi:Platelet-activating factor acetylhydrolase, isoform II
LSRHLDDGTCPRVDLLLSTPQPLSAIPTAQLTIPTLHIISDQFIKWKENYSNIVELLIESRQASAFAKLFYVKGSAHLSQSDFHLLFPAICRLYFHANRDADKIMHVNIRAGVEFLRVVGIEGVQGERDAIFEEKVDAWEELEKDI